MIHLTLFGTFRVTHGLEQTVTPRGQKACALLAYLALAPDGRASREKLIGLLWSTRPEEHARASLRQSLNELRRGVNTEPQDLITADRHTVRLRREQVWVDALALKQLAQGVPWTRPEPWPALYQGALLEGLDVNDPAFEEWLYTERAYYRSLLCTTLHRELAARMASATGAEAMGLAQHILSIEPTDEEAHRALMRCYAQQGNTALALRQYHVCHDILQREFQVAPSAPTEALYQRLRTGPEDSTEVAPAPPAWSGPPSAPSVRERTSIAVMPFRNLSPDPEHAYFADGLAEDITAALSRFKWLFVISQRATLPYKGRDLDLDEVGRQFGVPYLLDGSVRRSATQVRITVNLSNVAQRETIWSAQYDSTQGELFAVQDEITARIVGQLDPKLRGIEIERVARKAPEQFDAHDSMLRGMALMNTMAYGPFMEARTLLETAIQLDPTYATAHAWLAYWHLLLMGQGWTQDIATSMAHADGCARTALMHDPEDALALTIAAHVASFRYHQFDQAMGLFERALQLNPNLVFAWALSAATCCYIGAPDEALRRLAYARQLCPFDPYAMVYETVYCIAHTLARRYGEAAMWGRKVVHENPHFVNGYKPIIVILSYLGLTDEARSYVRRLLQIEPDFCIQAFRDTYPLRQASDREHYIAGLRKAGIPEVAVSAPPNVLTLHKR